MKSCYFTKFQDRFSFFDTYIDEVIVEKYQFVEFLIRYRSFMLSQPSCMSVGSPQAQIAIVRVNRLQVVCSDNNIPLVAFIRDEKNV